MLYRHIRTGALIDVDSAVEGDWQAVKPASPPAASKAPAKEEPAAAPKPAASKAPAKEEPAAAPKPAAKKSPARKK